MTSSVSICPQCNGQLDQATEGPCPACLMQLGMNAWIEQANTQAPVGDVRSAIFPGAEPENGIHPEELSELSRLFPKLEILHVIGHGGMGTVYCARQKTLDRLVALKVIRPDLRRDDNFELRFAREAKALAQLNHPNIISVYDFGQVEDVYFFIMEFVDGINLRQMLLGQKLTPFQALQIVPGICDALQYAHENGVVHRDIKPENILIGTDGSVKIADFGLAKLLDKEATKHTQLTQVNQVMGTMHYMAPEQIEKPTEVDHRADIYSLGVVIYELLTGELPIGRFAPPSRKVQVDIRLDEIVLQTLEKEPALRYQHAKQIKTDVESLAAQRRAAATPQQPAPEVVRRPVAPVKSTAAYTYLPPKHFGGPVPNEEFYFQWASFQTYKNLLYNFLSFPLGLFYFVFFVVCLSVGISTLIVWIGFIFLFLAFGGARLFIAMERVMAQGLLNVPLATDVPRRKPETKMQYFFNGRTWKDIGYLVSRFPLGILSLVTTVTLIAVPLSLMATPILIWFSQPDLFFWKIDTISEAAVVTCFGFLLGISGAVVNNWVAWLHAKWARVCLRRPNRGLHG